jgi:outer membrane lipoprotein-sorting protein
MIRNNTTHLFLVLFILFMYACDTTVAQTNDFRLLDQNSDAKHKIRETALNIHTIHCDFIQIKRMHYLDSDLKSSGKFWYNKPDKMRWEYIQPYEYIIILNQEKISLISNNTSNQYDVKNNNMFNQMNELIVDAVSGNIFDNSGYTTNTYESKDLYMVKLQPESPDITKIIQNMELYFDKNSYTLNKLKIIEPNSDYSLIYFSNQILNEVIPENIFIH